jgi:CRISPR/Cas system-associated exonuclease Cas4 (RecB family)
VQLSIGLRLAGAIDLVERARDAAGGSVLRATDHKTGSPLERLGTVNGGRVLQPLLYALALEQLFPGDRVASGRLYFCTERGEFKRCDVPLDESSRGVASELIASIDKHVADGFLPAAPASQPEDRARSECDRCAYRVVCGPYEGERLRVKGRDLTRLAPLSHVRNLP